MDRDLSLIMLIVNIVAEEAHRPLGSCMLSNRRACCVVVCSGDEGPGGGRYRRHVHGQDCGEAILGLYSNLILALARGNNAERTIRTRTTPQIRGPIPSPCTTPEDGKIVLIACGSHTGVEEDGKTPYI